MKTTFIVIGFTSFLGFIMLQDVGQDVFAYADKLSLIGFMFVVIYVLVNYIKRKEIEFGKKEDKLNSILIQILMHSITVGSNAEDEKIKMLVSKIDEISKKEN